MIDNAADKDAKIICLPELFTTGFDYDYINECTKPIPNIITDVLAKKAKELEIHIIGGSIPEKYGNKRYNTSILFDSRGRIIGKYRKVHLFPLMNENRIFTHGNKLGIFRTEFGIFGIEICYDIRFPEVTRNLTYLGTKLVFIPSAFPHPRMGHWKTLVYARAIENQIFVIAVNRVGKDSSNNFFGRSLIVDPWGELLACSGSKEEVVEATIDMSSIDKVRKQLPCLRNMIDEVDKFPNF